MGHEFEGSNYHYSSSLCEPKSSVTDFQDGFTRGIIGVKILTLAWNLLGSAWPNEIKLKRDTRPFIERSNINSCCVTICL